MITTKQFLSIILLSLIGIWFFRSFYLTQELTQQPLSSLSPPKLNGLLNPLISREIDSSSRNQNRLNWNEYQQSLNEVNILECEPTADPITIEEYYKPVTDFDAMSLEERQVAVAKARQASEQPSQVLQQARLKAEALSNLPGLSKGANNQVIAALLGSIYDEPESDEPESDEVSPSAGSSRIAQSLQTLSIIVEQYPQNRLASMHLLRACELQGTLPACDDQMIERAKILNADNSVFWSTLAGLRLAEGDLDAAVAALQQAVEAPEYNDYFSQHLELFHNAMSLVEDDSDTILASPRKSQNYMTSLNYASSSGFVFGRSVMPLFKFCRENVSEREDIAAVCFDYGARMEKDGTTLLSHLSGSALQIQVSETLGNTELKQQLQEQDSIYREKLFDDDYSKASSLMGHDELLTLDYFQTWIAYGELQAIQYIVEEARRLSADPDYDPCN